MNESPQCFCNSCQEKREDKDNVNHPKHYQGNVIEVIDVIEDFDLNFNLGNAVKYILRSEKKENFLTDLKKAIWYLEREVERVYDRY